MVFTVIIRHDRVAITVQKKDVLSKFDALDRMDPNGIDSVMDAVEARMHSWPGKIVTKAVGKIIGSNLAAMKVLDRTFILRCPMSHNEIARFQMEQSDDDFECI
jgi:hypothetical protein